MTSTANLAAAALRMRSEAPRTWDDFLLALDAYVLDVTVAVTDAPQDQVLLRQGYARNARELLRIFQTCHQQPAAQRPRAQ